MILDIAYSILLGDLVSENQDEVLFAVENFW